MGWEWGWGEMGLRLSKYVSFAFGVLGALVSIPLCGIEIGAGDGNRTRISRLETCGNNHYTTPAKFRRVFKRGDSN